MDINLHSFILVVGVIVIGFIVWDGVKKVRAARANQLNQTLEGYDHLDAPSEQEDLPVFDDLEFKDELLQQALSDVTDESLVSLSADGLSTVSNEADSVSQGTTQQDSSDMQTQWHESTEAEKKAPIFNVQNEVQADDEFEHFSARDDVIDGADQALAQRLHSQLEDKQDTLSTQDKRASAVLATPQTEKPARRVSKETLAAKLEKAQADAKAPVLDVEAKPDITLDDKEPVPVLMEPVELGQKVDPNPPKQQELVLPELIQQTLQDEPVYATQEEPVIASVKPDPLMEYIEDVQALPVGEKLSEREAAQEIFVINILKQDGKGLMGQDLHHVFNVCDMRHGEMGIFHRFEKANAQGKIQFSVVNAIEPGNFNLNTIENLVTPGISLFMSLPGPDKPMEAFDAMAEVALVFARNFNATLHDDTHSDLTPQTLEHYRNRVREFSRKHLSHKK